VKTAAAFILSLIYITYAIGITVHKHYCMGELVGKSLLSFKNQECGKCGMKKHTAETKDCCQDISTLIKSSEDHNYSTTTYAIHHPDIIVPAPPIVLYLIGDVAVRENNTIYLPNGPPGYERPLYIQFQNFRI